jgi:hypothetical protein
MSTTSYIQGISPNKFIFEVGTSCILNTSHLDMKCFPKGPGIEAGDTISRGSGNFRKWSLMGGVSFGGPLCLILPP